MTVHFYDVGQALAVLVELPDGRHVLVDTGDEPHRPGCGEACGAANAHLLSSLRADLHGAPIDLLWITHPHSGPHRRRALGARRPSPCASSSTTAGRPTGPRCGARGARRRSTRCRCTWWSRAAREVPLASSGDVRPHRHRAAGVAVRLRPRRERVLDRTADRLRRVVRRAAGRCGARGGGPARPRRPGDAAPGAAPRERDVDVAGLPRQGEAQVRGHLGRQAGGRDEPRLLPPARHRGEAAVAAPRREVRRATLASFDGDRCDRATPADWVAVPTSDRLWATERDGDVVLTTTGDGVFRRWEATASVSPRIPFSTAIPRRAARQQVHGARDERPVEPRAPRGCSRGRRGPPTTRSGAASPATRAPAMPVHESAMPTTTVMPPATTAVRASACDGTATRTVAPGRRAVEAELAAAVDVVRPRAIHAPVARRGARPPGRVAARDAEEQGAGAARRGGASRGRGPRSGRPRPRRRLIARARPRASAPGRRITPAPSSRPPQRTRPSRRRRRRARRRTARCAGTCRPSSPPSRSGRGRARRGPSRA